MKIIQISPMTNLDSYGAARTHTLSLAKNLLSLGNEIHLVVTGNKIFSDENKLKISTPKFKNPIGLKSYFSILSTIIKNNWYQLSFLRMLNDKDLIYERFLQFSFSSIVFSKIKKTPLVYEMNGIPDEELFGVFNLKREFMKKIVTSIIKFQLKNSNKIIVQTPELKRIISQRFNLNNIEVVPNGTDLFPLQIYERDIILKICYIGALDDRHGLDQVFETISSRKDNFIFFIVGDGNLRKQYELKYKGDKRFIFTGQLPHKKALEKIKESDVCITSNSNKNFPINKYGFYFCPLKLLEYSMAGKPTILFQSSNSFTKIFEKNNACFLVNSKKEFVKKLNLLLKNPKLAEKMGKNARKLVEKEFTWMKSAKKTEIIFKEVLAEHNKKLKNNHDSKK